MITKNDFKLKKLELQNEFYKLALSQFDFVKSVLKKYDGKKITKRIESELNKTGSDLKNYYLQKDHSWWKLSIYCDKRTFQDGKNWYYIDNSNFDFFNYINDDILDYSKIEKQMNDKAIYIKTKFEKQKEVLTKLDELIENRKKLFDEIDENTNSLRILSECFVGYDRNINFNIK